MKKLAISLLVILTSVILYCSLPTQAFADHEWAIGEWRLVQYFTQENGSEVTFNGRLRIQREHGRFSGSIYFDAVGNWEPLRKIEVSDETISFTRPTYEQRFYGHRHRDKMNGTYKDKLHQGEWKWRAEKE
jgi:hypothetical protein